MHEQSMDRRPEVFGDDGEYERLRQRLIMYFERRGCLAADILADECFTRLAASMKSGWQPSGLRTYLFGIAGNVYLEYMRSAGRLLEELPDNLISDSDTLGAENSRLIAREVVGRLSSEERDLMEAHYLDKISWKDLAGGVGVTDVGLRLRVMRLRNRLMEDFGSQLKSIGLKRKAQVQSARGGAR
jgi:DNA-directed RNA polymerase specialized sigma24 family protein